MGHMPFTHYVRPDGTRQSLLIAVDDVTAERAAELILAHYRFESEVLTTGLVHMDCCGMAVDGSDDDDVPIALELCSNNTEAIKHAAQTLVANAWQALIARVAR